MRSIFLVTIMSILFSSCSETNEIANTGVIIDELPHHSNESVNLRLIDSDEKWSKTTDFDKLELYPTNIDWKKKTIIITNLYSK